MQRASEATGGCFLVQCRRLLQHGVAVDPRYDRVVPRVQRVHLFYMRRHELARRNILFPQRAGEGNRAHVEEKGRSEEHTSELQSLVRISYAVFCMKNNNRIRLQPLTQVAEDSKHTHLNSLH